MISQYTPQEYEEQVLRRVEEAQTRLKQQEHDDSYEVWHQANQEC